MPKNTLFNYFSKCEKVSRNEDEASSPTVGTVPDVHGKSDSPKETAKSGLTENVDGVGYTILSLVWAKLVGFPWWPSIVCNHPVTENHIRNKGKKQEIHVQFFDSPPTRSWIKLSNIVPYKGLDDPSAPIKEGNSDWMSAVKEANKALNIPVEDRHELIVCVASENEDNHLQSSDEENITMSRKRKRKIEEEISDIEDSDDEFKPECDQSDYDSSSGVDESIISAPESEEPSPSPVQAKKRRKKQHTPQSRSISKTPKQCTLSFASPNTNGNRTPQFVKPNFSTPVSGNTKSKLSLFASPCEEKERSNADVDGKLWTHLQYDWLKDGKLRDKSGKLQNDPEYNPRTLCVPESAKKTLTPAHRQWWDLKTEHFDTILFFKVGKFYELFHQDAVVGVNELGLLYMRGEYAHSGFPEIAFSRYADILIQKGYKIARVEQTETPAMMEERCKKMRVVTKFDKVVNREICRVISKGARTYSFIDGDSHDYSNSYLLAITEKPYSESAGDEVVFGVCFVDASIGKFHLGQFIDDRHRSRLRTLISHYPPSQVLIERGSLSNKTNVLLETNLMSAIKDHLVPGAEFWKSNKTLTFLSNEKYFCENDGCQDNCFPVELKSLLDPDDVLGRTAKPDKDLAIKALGACTWYLVDCKIEQELLSMKSFECYVPVDDHNQKVEPSLNRGLATHRHMVLDGITLKNLDILENGSTGTSQGTLLRRIDQCSTPFGKRLIRQWLCSPLCTPNSVNDRLDAIEDLMQVSDVVCEVSDILKKLPDLERLLSKIHSQGSAVRSKSHPESRAIFFEENIYSKRKITDFLSTIQGFERCVDIANMFSKCSSKFRSKILLRCVRYTGDDGNFPQLKQHLAFFDNAFDHEKAKNDGKIIPTRGVDGDYDSSIDSIKLINKRLDEYLRRQKAYIGPKVTYYGSGKNRYQLEVPDNCVHCVPDDFEVQSQRKGFKRYWTSDLKDHLNEIMSAEDRRDAALKDIMRRIFEQFDAHYKEWMTAVQCVAVLDVLITLSNYSKSANMCRPVLLSPAEVTKPCLEIRQGRHPCLESSYSGDKFIPNDVTIAVENDEEKVRPSLVVVTGPNMGGKSTLMRQTGLVVILAQLGCYVPAAVCVLTPVDRVFTRLGASDRIMHGESTFFVELSETSSILQHATVDSLVLVDELGRGTATFDGTAIASSVVRHLTYNIRCRTLFSTHYHSLVEEFSKEPLIRLGHMACMVENENDEDPSQETITFLYKFKSGACPKSYGFNVARLAGLPEEVICEGHKMAVNFEKSMERSRLFRNVFRRPVTSDYSKLQEQIGSVFV